jgi:hypothetical protein
VLIAAVEDDFQPRDIVVDGVDRATPSVSAISFRVAPRPRSRINQVDLPIGQATLHLPSPLARYRVAALRPSSLSGAVPGRSLPRFGNRLLNLQVQKRLRQVCSEKPQVTRHSGDAWGFVVLA